MGDNRQTTGRRRTTTPSRSWRRGGDQRADRSMEQCRETNEFWSSADNPEQSMGDGIDESDERGNRQARGSVGCGCRPKRSPPTGTVKFLRRSVGFYDRQRDWVGNGPREAPTRHPSGHPDRPSTYEKRREKHFTASSLSRKHAARGASEGNQSSRPDSISTPSARCSSSISRSYSAKASASASSVMLVVDGPPQPASGNNAKVITNATEKN